MGSARHGLPRATSTSRNRNIPGWVIASMGVERHELPRATSTARTCAEPRVASARIGAGGRELLRAIIYKSNLRESRGGERKD
eukprot:649006-Alexandrium_andersonii.AAC.1